MLQNIYFKMYYILFFPNSLRCIQVEEYKCEIHSGALEAYTNIISQSDPADEGFRTYLIDDSTFISLKEKLTIISDGTTGLCTWQAAFYLTEWCIQHAEEFRQKKILELGSGSGLVGLSLFKKCQPSSVILTDHHPKVLEKLRVNVQNNIAAPSVKVEPLDWIDYSQRPDETFQADIVLASG